MVILSGKTLTRGVAFVPEEASLTLEERGGSLQLTLGPDQPDVSVGTWLLDDSGPGKGIVWRIKTIQESDDTRTRTVTCEHIINSLKDRIIYDEIDNGDVTAKWAINKALSYQNEWKLGTLSYNITKPFTFNGESVFDAIETVCTAMDDPVWTFDMSAKPFTLNIVKRSSAVQSELRIGRNLKTLKKTIDRTGMYTRLYPRGVNDLTLSGSGYVERNTDLFGVITKMETDQSQTTEAMLRVWAEDRLKRHCEPTVSIAIDGLELADATGESLDRLRIGTICRVPLPDLGTTIKEKITRLNWKKLISAPEEVTVTLCNTVTDLASFIKNESSSGTAAAVKSSRSSAKKAKEDHAWFTDTEDHVSMTAEAILGKDASGKVNWSRLADLSVDGNGIHGRVTETENGLVTHETRIEATEKAITLEANNRSKADEELSGRIKVAADSIDAEVTRAKNEETQLRGALNVQADCVSLVTGVGDGKGLKYYATLNEFPKTGSTKFLYMAVDSGKYYSWNGSKYVETSANAKIKAGGIVSAINADGTSTTRILGTRVVVGSDLSADSLPDWCNTTEGLIAEKATIVQLNALKARVGTLEADSITTATLASKIANLDGVTMKILKVNSVEIPAGEGNQLKANAVINAYGGIQDRNGHVYNVYDASVSGNVLTIKKLDGNDVTFSKATSLSGAWSGGVYQVTAKQNGTTVATHNYDPPMRLNGVTSASNFSAEVYEVSGSTTTARKSVYGYLVSTANGASSYVDVNTKSDGTGTSVARLSVGSIYTGGRTDGWNQARGKVRVPGSGSAASITAQWPGANYNTTENRKYELTDDGDNTVILRYNTAESGQQPNYVTAARYRHGKYEDGYADGKSDYEEVHSNEISAGDPENIGTDSTGYTNIGGIARPASRTYVGFTVTVRGKSKDFCISIN